MKVYTFYMECLDGADAFEAMHPLWEESWKAHGWEPVLLMYSDVRIRRQIILHPLFDLFRTHPAFTKTLNPPDYELACFLRWLVMAELPTTDVVMMADYDVMNYGYFPSMLALELNDRYLTLLNEHSPSVVAGTPKQFGHMAQFFAKCAALNYGARQNSVSDQNYIAHNWPYPYAKQRMVRESGEPSSLTAPMVHYSTAWTPDPRIEYTRQDFAKRKNWK